MDVAHEVNLDISHLSAARITTESVGGESVAPDVLVVPSRYKQFVKVEPDLHILGSSALMYLGRMLTTRWLLIRLLQRRGWWRRSITEARVMVQRVLD